MRGYAPKLTVQVWFRTAHYLIAVSTWFPESKQITTEPAVVLACFKYVENMSSVIDKDLTSHKPPIR